MLGCANKKQKPHFFLFSSITFYGDHSNSYGARIENRCKGNIYGPINEKNVCVHSCLLKTNPSKICQYRTRFQYTSPIYTYMGPLFNVIRS